MPYEALARIVLMRRSALGLTQVEMAARMGTTASAISRIEGGQHAASPPTLKKLADALGARAVLGFEFGSAEHPERELVLHELRRSPRRGNVAEDRISK